MGDARPWLKAQVDQAVVEQLQAIALSDPNGRPTGAAMLRTAVAEFIVKRIGTPEAQQALATIRGQPLRLVAADAERKGG